MIRLEKNNLDVDSYLHLRACVNWKVLQYEQAKKAIANSMYIVTAYYGDELVGMGRIVGDGAVICYVQDLIVVPAYQSKKVGSIILDDLIAYVEDLRLDDSTMMLCLMCAKGREPFYLKHGFTARPTDDLGPGMIQYLR